jgi:hypothetical protein
MKADTYFELPCSPFKYSSSKLEFSASQILSRLATSKQFLDAANIVIFGNWNIVAGIVPDN